MDVDCEGKGGTPLGQGHRGQYCRLSAGAWLLPAASRGTWHCPLGYCWGFAGHLCSFPRFYSQTVPRTRRALVCQQEILMALPASGRALLWPDGGCPCNFGTDLGSGFFPCFLPSRVPLSRCLGILLADSQLSTSHFIEKSPQ